MATWGVLRPHAKKRWPKLLWVLVLGSITSIAQAAVLTLFVPLWNQVLFPKSTDCVQCGQPIPVVSACPSCGSPLASGDAGPVSPMFDGVKAWPRGTGPFDDPRLAMLVAISILAFVLAVIGALAQWAFTWTSRRVSYQMLVDLRVEVARHLMGLSMRYHGERKLGDL